MNIKTLLTDEEKIKLVVEYAKSGSQDVIDLVVASVDAQDAKTKRVMFEEAERLIETYNWFMSVSESVMGTPDWEEFKKWALGE